MSPAVLSQRQAGVSRPQAAFVARKVRLWCWSGSRFGSHSSASAWRRLPLPTNAVPVMVGVVGSSACAGPHFPKRVTPNN